jgi:hypothetical protein
MAKTRAKSFSCLLKRIPSSFEAFNYTIPVKMVEEIEDDAPVSEDYYCQGSFYPEDMVILLKSDMSKKLTLEVFCHEWFEMANVMTDLKLSHSQITTLGNLLAQMLGTGR